MGKTELVSKSTVPHIVMCLCGKHGVVCVIKQRLSTFFFARGLGSLQNNISTFFKFAICYFPHTFKRRWVQSRGGFPRTLTHTNKGGKRPGPSSMWGPWECTQLAQRVVQSSMERTEPGPPGHLGLLSNWVPDLYFWDPRVCTVCHSLPLQGLGGPGAGRLLSAASGQRGC